jgi:hypothetical protein
MVRRYGIANSAEKKKSTREIAAVIIRDADTSEVCTRSAHRRDRVKDFDFKHSSPSRVPGSLETGSGRQWSGPQVKAHVDPMGTRPAYRFPDGTHPIRNCGPAYFERRRASRSLRCASSGAYRHIRFYRVARARDFIEASSAWRAHRRRRNAHVCRSHPRQAGTVAIPPRQRVKSNWWRCWRSNPGAATRRFNKSGEVARLFVRAWTVETFCYTAGRETCGSGCLIEK